MQTQETFNEEILKRIDAFAEKLGLGAGELWEVLVRRAVLDGWLSLVVDLLVLAVCAFALPVALRRIRALSIPKNSCAPMDDELAGFCWLAITLALFAATLIFFSSAGDAILAILQPEYVAWRELAEVLR